MPGKTSGKNVWIHKTVEKAVEITVEKTVEKQLSRRCIEWNKSGHWKVID